MTFLTTEFGLAKLGSAGKPPLFTEVRIVDADGEVLTEPVAKGEVCASGPNVMKGYWNKPEATAAAIDAEGWFHTGDVGYLDDDGFLYIADRVKDMVITGGENVYPAEVESVLYDHPAVAEVAVIGLPDERWGEVVVAVAALKPGASLDARGAARLRRTSAWPATSCPTRLELVDALPRNPAGKVLKFQLREQFGSLKPVARRPSSPVEHHLAGARDDLTDHVGVAQDVDARRRRPRAPPPPPCRCRG